MRWYITTTILGGLLALLAGCPLRQYATRHHSVEGAARPHALVAQLASYDQLGSAWKELEGAGSIHDIHATPDAGRALIRLRGWGGPAIWYEEGAFTQTMLGQDPAFVDPSQGLMFKVEPQAEGYTNKLLSYHLPRRELASAQDIPRGEVLSLASQPGELCAWFAVYRNADGKRAASLEVGWFTAETLFGVTLKRDESAAPPDGARVIPLAAGGALIAIDGALYHVLRDGQQHRLNYQPPGDRSYKLSADLANAGVFWVLTSPLADGLGTGREAGASGPGELVSVHIVEGELARLSTGMADFSKAAGDWDNRRALLVQAQTGVALADFNTAEMTWLLRQSAETPAYLLPGGQVWAFGADGVAQITADELIALAPKLSASELLTRDQIEVIKPLTQLLGWQWSETQVSPLAGSEGSISFFNTGNLDASLAEFSWDLENERVDTLHIARTPTAADRELLAQSSTGTPPPATEELLAVLGWPDALWLQKESFLAAGELRGLYELMPDQRPPGTFTLWITEEATFMQLAAEGTFEPEPEPEPVIHDESSHMEGAMHGDGGEAPAADATDNGTDDAGEKRTENTGGASTEITE